MQSNWTDFFIFNKDKILFLDVSYDDVVQTKIFAITVIIFSLFNFVLVSFKIKSLIQIM